jgi:uncharacterized protein YjgD (DUF1641 family)
MASDDHSVDAAPPLDDHAELARAVDENAEELAELLCMLAVAEELAADLAPELRETVRENREPLRELRLALEREETLDLLRTVGDEADTLVDLLDVLSASQSLAEDLVPELRVAVHENRDAIERLRFALEREETLALAERLGENADTLADLLDLLDATHDLATDLAPELRSVTNENRDAIRELRMAAAGFAEARAEHDVDVYELGRNAGNMLAFVETLGDPRVTGTLDAAVEGFAQEDPEPVGVLGLLGALFDADVRRALGRLLAAARAIGRADVADD